MSDIDYFMVRDSLEKCFESQTRPDGMKLLRSSIVFRNIRLNVVDWYVFIATNRIDIKRRIIIYALSVSQSYSVAIFPVIYIRPHGHTNESYFLIYPFHRSLPKKALNPEKLYERIIK